MASPLGLRDRPELLASASRFRSSTLPESARAAPTSAGQSAWRPNTPGHTSQSKAAWAEASTARARAPERATPESPAGAECTVNSRAWWSTHDFRRRKQGVCYVALSCMSRQYADRIRGQSRQVLGLSAAAVLLCAGAAADPQACSPNRANPCRSAGDFPCSGGLDLNDDGVVVGFKRVIPLLMNVHSPGVTAPTTICYAQIDPSAFKLFCCCHQRSRGHHRKLSWDARADSKRLSVASRPAHP